MNHKNINSSMLYPTAIKRAMKHLYEANQDINLFSGVTGDGPIRLFESKFGSVVDGRYVVALSNCTSAIYVALLASGVGPGDEVILPDYTWPQTLTPVIYTGATPVFADIECRSFSIDPISVRTLISSKTKAIIGGHLYGIPANVVQLAELAQNSNCTLIIDAAQGFGAMINGKGIGAYGDYIAFSFGLGKLFSIGEGGVLVCKNDTHYEYAVGNSQHPLRMHRDIDNHQLRKCIDGVAMNFRMHPLIASLALGQMEGMEKSGRVDKMREHYLKIFSIFEKLNLLEYLPELPLGISPSGAAFPLMIDNVEDIQIIKKYFDRYKLDIYDGGIITPLHLTSTITDGKLLFNHKNIRRKIEYHDTHLEGSCPNAEKRSQSPQLFIKSKLLQ